MLLRTRYLSKKIRSVVCKLDREPVRADLHGHVDDLQGHNMARGPGDQI